jgi:hypothetical protein
LHKVLLSKGASPFPRNKLTVSVRPRPSGAPAADAQV